LRFPHLLDSPLTDGGKVVSLTHRLPFTPQGDSWYSFLSDAESNPRVIVRLEGLGKLKKSTSSGLEPAIFRLVYKKKELEGNIKTMKMKYLVGCNITLHRGCIN
jgi:hypothetical protein